MDVFSMDIKKHSLNFSIHEWQKLGSEGTFNRKILKYI